MERRAANFCLEPGSSDWPAELEAIEDPPERLWARGRIELLAATAARGDRRHARADALRRGAGAALRARARGGRRRGR
jgi:predicted Rossmann fold nucleotide-binding protein DprA/Smf involved in DNA uptake